VCPHFACGREAEGVFARSLFTVVQKERAERKEPSPYRASVAARRSVNPAVYPPSRRGRAVLCGAAGAAARRRAEGGGGRCSWKSPAWGVGHILGWDSMTEADTNKQRGGGGGGEGGGGREGGRLSQAALAQLSGTLSLCWKEELGGCALCYRGSPRHAEKTERNKRRKANRETRSPPRSS